MKYSIVAALTATLYGAWAVTSAGAAADYAQFGAGAADIGNECLGNNGESVDAMISVCNKVVALPQFHGYAWPYYARARAYMMADKYDLALADVESALKNKGAKGILPDLYDMRCVLRLNMGAALADALADCNQSLQLKPDNVYVLAHRAAVEIGMENYGAAIQDATASLTSKDDAAEAYYLRGVAKQRAGDAAGGNADIASAKAIDPKIGD